MGFKDWITYTLDELYEFGSGLSKPRSEFGFGQSFLTFKDVFHNYFVPESLPELVNTNEKEQENCSIIRGDVFLTRTSEKFDELGMSSVALKDYPQATFNGFTKRLRPREGTKEIVIPEYAAFYFRSKRFRNQVTSMATMTTRASLNNSMLAKLQMDLPSINEQKIMVNLLYSMHKKVEMNKRIISNLEQLAQTLFKRWFVDFEFPNENGEPYKSSGGEMVESELGMIPKGWEVKPLDQIANYTNGLAMQRFRPEDMEDSLPVLKIKELRQGRTNVNSDRCSVNIKDSVKIFDGDVIFSWSATLLVKFWYGGNAGLNQHLFKVTSDDYPKWFYYQWTKSHLEQFKAIALDKATTMGHINRSHLSESKVVIPKQKQMERFTKYFSPLKQLEIERGLETHRLEALRDTLLPKLLLGEIELLDEEEVTENLSIS